MATKSNTLEGYSTNPTTISSGNSGGGSGDAFDGVNIDSTETLEATTAHAAHGSWSMHAATSATSGQSYAQWFSGVSGTTLYGRAYVYVTSAPGSNTNIVRFLVGTGTIIFTLRLNSSGKAAFLYSSGTLGGTSTNSFPTNQWFRFEYKVVASTTAGSVDVKCFFGANPDDTTATETLSVSGVNTGSNSSMDRNRIGIISSVASTDIWFDDLVWTDTGYPGPASSAVDATVTAASVYIIKNVQPASIVGGTGASVTSPPTAVYALTQPAAITGTTGATIQAAPIDKSVTTRPATVSGDANVAATSPPVIVTSNPAIVTTGSNGVVNAAPLALSVTTKPATVSGDAVVSAARAAVFVVSDHASIVGGTAGIVSTISPPVLKRSNPATVSGTTGTPSTSFQGWGIPLKTS